MANPRPPVHYEFPDMNPDDRLRELILYIADRCSSDPTFSATKLNKILFYSDFLSFGRYGKPITGCAYKALEKGPAPRGLNFVRDRMVDSDDIRIRKSPVYTHERHQIIPLRAPELVMFSARDIKVVDEMIELTLGELAKDVSEDSHWRAWWIARDRLTEGGSDLIPYEAVFISNDPLTNADIKRVRELNNRFHWE